MKKNIAILFILSFTFASYFFISCRHEIPCDELNFSISTNHTDCTNNLSDGSITATATGGGNFEFSLSDTGYQSSGLFANLSAGTYIVRGRNGAGCFATDTVVIIGGAPSPCNGVNITLTETHVIPAIGQLNGSITITASPAGTYTYSLNGQAFQNSNTFTGLAEGGYTILAKNTDGCTSAPLSVSLNSTDPCAGVIINLTETHVSPTTGNANGSIAVTANPSGNYTYSLNGAAFQSSNNFTGLAEGVYNIVAKNTNGCTSATLSIILTAINPCSGVVITLTETHTNPTTGQSNGAITVTANPAGTYTYSLNGAAFQSNNTFPALAAGTYTIIAKNANGCTSAPISVTLGSVDPCTGVVITVNTTKVDPFVGQSNGSITATAAPAGTYTYSINGSAYQSTGIFANLAAGTYTITAKNTNGCIGSSQVTLVAIDPCAGLTITVSTTKLNSCSGQTNGSITATANPTGTYTYSNNGSAYQSTGIFANLAAGTYTITAKNSNGCLGSAPPVTLTTTSITMSVTAVNVLPCPSTNGSITITATGSTGFTYNKNGGTYQASNVFSGLTAGTYVIGVKDINGCTNTQSVTIGTLTKGTNFNNVRTIIHGYCGNCHLNGGNTAGYNFDNDCSIVTYWSQIKGSCVSPYTLRRMPTSGPLSTTLQAQITAWVNAGHRYTD